MGGMPSRAATFSPSEDASEGFSPQALRFREKFSDAGSSWRSVLSRVAPKDEISPRRVLLPCRVSVVTASPLQGLRGRTFRPPYLDTIFIETARYKVGSARTFTEIYLLLLHKYYIAYILFK